MYVCVLMCVCMKRMCVVCECAGGLSSAINSRARRHLHLILSVRPSVITVEAPNGACVCVCVCVCARAYSVAGSIIRSEAKPKNNFVRPCVVR